MKHLRAAGALLGLLAACTPSPPSIPLPQDCPRIAANAPVELGSGDLAGSYQIVAIAETGPSKRHVAGGVLRLQLDTAQQGHLIGATDLDATSLGVSTSGWDTLPGDSLPTAVRRLEGVPGIQLEIGGGTLIHGGVTLTITGLRRAGYTGYWRFVQERPVASGHFCLDRL